jgi:hypothetical protein
MLLHGCHNAMLVLVGWWQASQEQVITEVMEVEHLPWEWLAAGAGGMLFGFTLLFLSRRRPDALIQPDIDVVDAIAE